MMLSLTCHHVLIYPGLNSICNSQLVMQDSTYMALRAICFTGTSEAVNPGLALSSNATTATAGFTFQIADKYKLCYKVPNTNLRIARLPSM